MPKTKKRPRTTKEIGKLINKRYKILRHLSAGGQGIIYLVQDEQSNYPSFYAIKQSRQDHKNSKFWTTIDTIFNSLTQEATDITFNRSTQEAAILRDLTQDGVSQIPCYENYFKLKQEYYLVQEFIQGKTIKEILHTVKNFNEFQIIAFLQDVLNILIRLHSYYVTSNNQAMYHRDIKPSNLMWQEDKGHIVIVDFGITKYRGFVDLKNEEIRQIRTKRKRLSQNYHLFQQRQYDQMTETEDEDETGIMVTGGVEFCGTPPYAAPESWVGNVYPSSDIYSLGVTAIEALTGQAPSDTLTGQAPSDTLTGQTPNVDSAINKYDRGLISDELADILEKMIDSKHQERYQSAQEVLDELEPLNAVGNVLRQRYRIVKVINYLNQESFYTETINHTYIAIDTRAFSQQVIIREFSPQSQDIEVLQEAQHILDTECQKLEEINRLNIAIPRLLDYFSEDSKFYVVYEIIEGRYLSQDVFFKQELKQNWGEQQVIQFIKELLITLDSMHNCNCLHLDIKPSKIVTTDQGAVYLTGAARIEEISNLSSNPHGGIRITNPVGTADYMSPEQQRGEYFPNSDLYSLGIIAIQLLTGKEPQTIKNDKARKNLWPKNIKVQTGLKKILEQMVEEKRIRGRRYQSAHEVIDDLNKLPKPGELLFTIHRIKYISVFQCIIAAIFVMVTGLSLVFLPQLQIVIKYNQAAAQLEQAEKTKEPEKYKLALESFNDILEKKPDFYQARVSKAYVMEKLDFPDNEIKKECELAKRFFEEARQAKPNSLAVEREIERIGDCSLQ